MKPILCVSHCTIPNKHFLIMHILYSI